jgi:hypothetical protein
MVNVVYGKQHAKVSNQKIAISSTKNLRLNKKDV